MKRFAVIAAIICLSLSSVCSCSDNSVNADVTTVQASSADEISADLTAFLNEKMPAVIEKYDVLLAQQAYINSLDSDSSPEDLTECIDLMILPSLAEAVTLLNAIHTDTAEVGELKALYQSSIEQYKRGYASLLMAFDEIDELGVQSAFDELKNAELTMTEYNTRLAEMCKTYNVNTEQGDTK